MELPVVKSYLQVDTCFLCPIGKSTFENREFPNTGSNCGWYIGLMQRLRKLAIYLILPVGFYFVVTEFGCEILAFGWHARHGNTATLKSFHGGTFRVPVPSLWMAIVDDGGWSVGIHKKAGSVRSYLRKPEWAMMSFSVAPTYQTANEMRNVPPIVYSKTGMVFAEVASVSVAGQELYCFEQKWEKGKLAELTLRYGTVDLHCAPESDKRSFSATYTGSRNLMPEFYDVLRGVAREQAVAQR